MNNQSGFRRILVFYNKKGLKQSKYFNYLSQYFLLLPVIIYYIIFAYLPMTGLIIAFKDYNLSKGIFASPWVGLKHFERFIVNEQFWEVFRNTIVLAFYRILYGFLRHHLCHINCLKLKFNG